MQRPLRDALLVLSLANLCFFRVWSAYFYGYFRPYFRKDEFLGADYAALMLDVVLLAAIFWLGALALRRWKGPLARFGLRALFLVVLLNVVYIIWVGLKREPVQPVTDTPEPLPATILALVVAAGALALWALWCWRVPVARVGVHLVLIASPFVIVTFGQATWMLVEQAPKDVPGDRPEASRLTGRSPGAPRVLWVVFDGLDQRLAFVERPRGVELPELDRLRSQAVYAENAYPPSGATIFSLPSFLTGQMVNYAEPSGAGELMISLGRNLEIVPWSEQATLFSRARKEGINSSLVGWFHPYCRILGDELTECSWVPFQFTGKSRSLLTRARDGFVLLVWCLPYADVFFANDPLGLDLLPTRSFRGSHLQKHFFILEEANRMATDPSLGLVFVHAVVPHGPPIYDRHGEKFGRSADYREWYLDNLAATDRALGEWRKSLEQAGLWEQTAILITSDHNWRQSFTLDKKRDPRVPFLVKLPGQKGSVAYKPAVSTVLGHDLVLAILGERLTDPQQVVDWLDEHRARFEVPKQ